MKLLKKALLISMLALGSAGASAELISTDWKSSNDNLATLDTATGIEWLDLSLTVNMAYSAAATGNLAGFEGWRLATNSEVETLFEHSFDNPVYGSNGYVRTVEDIDLLNELDSFNAFFGSTLNGNLSYGLFMDENSILRLAGVHTGIDRLFGPNYISDLSHVIDGGNYSQGLFLVSDGGITISSINNPGLNINNANAPINAASVPLPASVGLLGLGLLGFARRKA